MRRVVLAIAVAGLSGSASAMGSHADFTVGATVVDQCEVRATPDSLPDVLCMAPTQYRVEQAEGVSDGEQPFVYQTVVY